MQETTRDVVIIGSGAAGLTAAITAAIGGCSTLVIEKTESIGGTTAWSGGAAWLPNNPLMRDAGVEDSEAMATRYIRGVLGGYFDPTMIKAFLDNAPTMVEFLESKSSAVRFQPLKSVDYHPELDGATLAARSLIPLAFDGRLLGRWLPRLRSPKPEMTVFGGMQVDAAEALHLQHCWRALASLRVAAPLIGRFAVDRFRYGKGTRMIRGAALAGRLLRSALDAGVEFWTSAQATRLLGIPDNQVTGVEVEVAGQQQRIVATRGVLLASGGFSASSDLRKRYIPYPDQHIVVVLPGNIGDGLRMGTAIGAELGPDNAANAIWSPSSQRRRSDGSLSTYPHFAFDRCKPGSVMVDGNGRRFVNEAASYHVIGNVMHERAIVPAWLIADRAFLRKYGMGMARPAPYPVRYLVRSGYLLEARTLDLLAAKIGANATSLRATIDKMNEFAQTGVDLEFAKGADPYSRSLGDPTHKPNPCLGRIGRPPYYALALYPGDAGTTLGLRVNSRAQVLSKSGEPIAGLYAAGLDMNSVLRGHYPGAGTMLGPALTFGYVAGRHLSTPGA